MARADLTTQEAADQLGVSHSYLVNLIETGRLSAYNVGHLRRIREEDLARFEQEDQERREQGTAELAALTEEIGLNYGAELERRQRLLDELVAQAEELDTGY